MKALATIKVEFYPGVNIRDAFKEASRLATFNNAHIEFTFNGVICVANPNSDPETGVKEYNEASESKKSPRFAFAR